MQLCGFESAENGDAFTVGKYKMLAEVDAHNSECRVNIAGCIHIVRRRYRSTVGVIMRDYDVRGVNVIRLLDHISDIEYARVYSSLRNEIATYKPHTVIKAHHIKALDVQHTEGSASGTPRSYPAYQKREYPWSSRSHTAYLYREQEI